MNPLLWKIGGAVLAVILLVGMFRYGQHWKGKAQKYNAEASAMVEQIKVIANNPGLERKDALQQLILIGQAKEHYADRLKSCSDKVDALGVESDQRQKEGAKALSTLQGRIKDIEQGQRALIRSSRQPQDVACLSSTLKEQWK